MKITTRHHNTKRLTEVCQRCQHCGRDCFVNILSLFRSPGTHGVLPPVKVALMVYLIMRTTPNICLMIKELTWLSLWSLRQPNWAQSPMGRIPLSNLRPSYCDYLPTIIIMRKLAGAHCFSVINQLCKCGGI